MRTSAVLRRARNTMLARGIARGSFGFDPGDPTCTLGAVRITLSDERRPLLETNWWKEPDYRRAVDALLRAVPTEFVSQLECHWRVAHYHDSSSDQAVWEMFRRAIELAERDEHEEQALAVAGLSECLARVRVQVRELVRA